MEQNRFAPGASAPEAAADEPASPADRPAADPPEERCFAFASPEEEDAYWAGVADGIRNAGGVHHPRLAARARDCYPELVGDRAAVVGRLSAAPDPLGFDPVSTRHRIDGWTPQKQREFIEALADSGVVRYAAARVGMSEQSVARLRRRADARSFDLACEAAHRIGARRLRSIAYERAIEGTIKRHHFRGEVTSEERVYDNRLLVYLLGRLDKLIDPPRAAAKVEANWQAWMEAIEAGAEPPPLDPPPEREAGYDPMAFNGGEVWEGEEGEWWTGFPPPAGFDGIEEGEPGDEDYRRRLSDSEQAVVDSDLAEERDETVALGTARRDLYFGFSGGGEAEADSFPPRAAEPTAPSEPSAPPGGPESEAGEAP